MPEGFLATFSTFKETSPGLCIDNYISYPVLVIGYMPGQEKKLV